MTTQVKTPQRENFYYANRISTIQIWLITIGSVLSFATLFTPNTITHCINISICIISGLYVITELVFPYFYQKAHEDKIKDLIDKSLGSKLCDENSENYYTNDEITDGLPKLGVNNFESVFFTKEIVGRMIKGKIAIFIIVILIYLGSIFVVEKSILITVFQLMLPIQIVKEFVYLWLFYSDVKKICENYNCIYTTFKKNERTPYIIQNVILYEKLLSNYNILTSTRIYNKINDTLSEEWNKNKQKYKI